MKRLTDTERLSIALKLLSEHEDIGEYTRLCEEREQDCERNGFHNVPAECEDYECSHCPLYYDAIGKKQIGCPYMECTTL